MKNRAEVLQCLQENKSTLPAIAHRATMRKIKTGKNKSLGENEKTKAK